MLFGLGLGLIVAVGVYLRTPGGASAPQPQAAAPAAAEAARPAATRTADTSAAQRSAPARTDETAAAPAEREPRFQFYEILPQFEVVVPEDRPASAGSTRASRPPPRQTPGSYLLQAGSFSAAADADKLQASLALLGYESHVQRVTIDDDVFNRVRIGPIADLDTAKRTQRRLRDAGIDTLLMQVPK